MDVYQRAATLYQASNNPEAAEEAIDLLLQNALSHPNEPKAWLELARCYSFLGRDQEALPCFEKALEAGHENLSESEQPHLFLHWGSSLRNLRRLDEAHDILLRGASLYPEVKALKAYLALTQYDRGDYQAAAQALFVLLHSKHPHDDTFSEHSRSLDWNIDHLDSVAPPSVAGQLHHVEIYVSNLARSLEFWAWFLGALGYKKYQSWDQGESWRLGETYLVFVQADSRFLDFPFHRKRPGLNHLAFHARSREQIDELARQIRERGLKILYEDRPNQQSDGEPQTLYFEDPDRIKVELVAP